MILCHFYIIRKPVRNYKQNKKKRSEKKYEYVCGFLQDISMDEPGTI